MPAAYTKKYIAWKAKKMQECTGLSALAMLLKKQQHQLQVLALQPAYNVFHIPKKDGSFRLIEDPAPALKKVQKVLNSYLQAVYYFVKSQVAYGFIINLKNDTDIRNIYTNAQKHCGSKYLLNVDMEDFFHAVTRPAVENLLDTEIFRFDEETRSCIAAITTQEGRLPMGAPTSPVLSNFACLTLDAELLAFARRNQLTCTRFADDISFSAQKPITQAHYSEIEAIIHSHRYRVNPEKVKWYQPKDEKVITGLHVTNNDVHLPPDYWIHLQQQVQHFCSAWCVKKKYNSSFQWGQLKIVKQELMGRLEFAEFVEGETNAQKIADIKDKIETAEQEAETFCSTSWDDLPYNW